MTNFEIKQKAQKKAHTWGIVTFVIALNLMKFFGVFVGFLGAVLIGFAIDKIFYNIFYSAEMKKTNN